MKNKIEACLHLATALVAAMAPFFLDPVVAGGLLAAISFLQAANASLAQPDNQAIAKQ